MGLEPTTLCTLVRALYLLSYHVHDIVRVSALQFQVSSLADELSRKLQFLHVSSEGLTDMQKMQMQLKVGGRGAMTGGVARLSFVHVSLSEDSQWSCFNFCSLPPLSPPSLPPPPLPCSLPPPPSLPPLSPPLSPSLSRPA